MVRDSLFESFLRIDDNNSSASGFLQTLSSSVTPGLPFLVSNITGTFQLLDTLISKSLSVRFCSTLERKKENPAEVFENRLEEESFHFQPRNVYMAEENLLRLPIQLFIAFYLKRHTRMCGCLYGGAFIYDTFLGGEESHKTASDQPGSSVLERYVYSKWFLPGNLVSRIARL